MLPEKIISSSPSDADADKQFMATFYDDYHRLMFATARGYTLDLSEMEDIVQDSLVRLMGKVSILRTLSRYNLTAYVVLTVKSTAIDRFRKEENKQKVLNKMLKDKQSKVFSFDDFTQSICLRDQLAHVWRNLSEDEQFLLEGKYIFGLSNDEMAAELHCKPDSIRMMLSRARKNSGGLYRQLDAAN